MIKNYETSEQVSNLFLCVAKFLLATLKAQKKSFLKYSVPLDIILNFPSLISPFIDTSTRSRDLSGEDFKLLISHILF